MKLKIVALFLSTIGLAATFSVFAEGDASAGQTKSATCAACHGADGNSPLGIWPSLAGQSTSYIEKQLQDFKAKRRTNETMSPMAEPVSEQDAQDLAAYFSSQSIKPGENSAESGSLGGQVYLKGNIKKQVIACVGCHGLEGEGNPNLQAPALGGQHAEYLLLQLKAFKSGERDNDTGKMMRSIVAQMTDEEMDAVAKYINALSR
ncbi:MAG: cytochrome c4 [Oceanicoccus sp.]|uniref:c-type cytochrome n=1 Tax=Oceanicoccus sp. TaxID=2691044 RepID=UPI002613072A|nr:c-type cytochrome [Oceanicoccus sp.]MCP3909211.1 cytochrome c4 [Oceanicoccus sp.]